MIRWRGLWLMMALINTTACGYLLKADDESPIGPAPTTLLPNGKLLVGVLPGVAIFAVDLEKGRLYLPADPGTAPPQSRLAPLASREGPDQADRAAIARKLAAWLGRPVTGEALNFYRYTSGQLVL